MTKSRVCVFNDFHTYNINCHLYVTVLKYKPVI